MAYFKQRVEITFTNSNSEHILIEAFDNASPVASISSLDCNILRRNLQRTTAFNLEDVTK